MTADPRLRRDVAPRSQDPLQGIELRQGEAVTADQTDAETRFVLPENMCTHPVVRAAWLDPAITPDDPVIPDAVPPEAEMHGMDFPRTDIAVVVGRRAMHDEMPNCQRFEQARTSFIRPEYGWRRLGLPCLGRRGRLQLLDRLHVTA